MGINNPSGILLMFKRSYRPIARGRHWAISTRNALASQAGELVFLKGGNAVDATIAALAALGVVEPAMSGIGGELFMLVYDPKTQKVYSINGGGTAPKEATVERYRSLGFDRMPLDGALSSVVPGAFDAWCIAVDGFGTMHLNEVLEPAIELSRNGFPISEEFVATTIANEERLESFNSSRGLYFKPDGSHYGVGELFKNVKLAELYGALAETEKKALDAGFDRHSAIKGARDEFYKGKTANDVVDFMRQSGGLFALEDLSDYYALIEEPAHASYKGYEVYKSPSANQGPAELEILNIIENFELKEAYSPQTIHLEAEAVNLAMADREKFLGDLNYIKSPVNGLVSKAYARERSTLIDEGKRLRGYSTGDPNRYEKEPYVYEPLAYFRSEDTVRDGKRPAYEATHKDPEKSYDFSDSMSLTSYACAADKSGLVASATPSNFQNFGSALVVEPFGFPINDRASYFRLDEGHANSLKPGKRARNTIAPSMALKDGKPYLAYGTPGADQQCQALFQILVNLVDFGMSIQEAIDAPMWSSRSFPLSYGDHRSEEGLIVIDERMSGVAEDLRRRDWRVEISEPFSNNRACIIRILDDCIEAAAMSTTEGQALAW
jgi:gamma-glutamyltranspeptidase/glutathione hydrolase